MLNAANAIRLRNALSGVTSVHLAKNIGSNNTDPQSDYNDNNI